MHFHQEAWARCQEDLEGAVLLGYPEDLQYRLAERGGRIHLRLGRRFEAQESFELAGQLVRKSRLTEQQKDAFRQDLKASLEKEVVGDEGATGDVEVLELPQLTASHPAIPGLSASVEVSTPPPPLPPRWCTPPPWAATPWPPPP